MASLTTSIVVLASLLAFSVGAVAQLSDDKLAAAQNLLERNGVDASIAIDQFIDYGNGGGIVSGYQLHDGLKVFDAPQTLHFAPGGEVVRTQDGEALSVTEVQDLSDLEIDVDELIDAEAALTMIRSTSPSPTDAVDADTLAAVRRCAKSADRLDVELGILLRNPAWQIRCKHSRAPGIFIDAATGDFISFNPNMQPGSLPIPLPASAPGER
jgi:hypothetical protein